MWRLLFLSSISCGLIACSGDDCGDPAAFEFGLTVSSAEVSLVYGDMTAGLNNDCTDPTTPNDISLTIEGSQMGGSGLGFTMCVVHPDKLETMALALGSSEIRINDLNGSDATCTYMIDSTQVPNGTVQGQHMCGNGVDPKGFGLVFNGHLGLRRTCGATVDSIAVGITGDVAVKPM